VPIEYPITVNDIRLDNDGWGMRPKGPFGSAKCGSWVSVRPRAPEHGGKTYLGVYLGELPTGVAVGFIRGNDIGGTIRVMPSGHNPAIFVPDLGMVVMGYESWWGEIDSPEALRQISDADIKSCWYVKALEVLTASASGREPDVARPVGDNVDGRPTGEPDTNRTSDVHHDENWDGKTA